MKYRSDKGKYEKEDKYFTCLNCLEQYSHHQYHYNKLKNQKNYSYSEWAKRKYCSDKCQREHIRNVGSPKRTRNTDPCLECGEPTPLQNRQFCSRKCHYKNRDQGISSENEKQRKSVAYKKWRKTVFERDNYTCQDCGIRNTKGLGRTVRMVADHIKPFALHKELRLDIHNGQTLCEDCHKNTDTYGRKAIYRMQPLSVGREA